MLIDLWFRGWRQIGNLEHRRRASHRQLPVVMMIDHSGQFFGLRFERAKRFKLHVKSVFPKISKTMLRSWIMMICRRHTVWVMRWRVLTFIVYDCLTNWKWNENGTAIVKNKYVSSSLDALRFICAYNEQTFHKSLHCSTCVSFQLIVSSGEHGSSEQTLIKTEICELRTWQT